MTKDVTAHAPDEADEDSVSWSEEDETRWQAGQAAPDIEESPLLTAVITRMREDFQAEVAAEAGDELAFRAGCGPSRPGTHSSPRPIWSAWTPRSRCSTTRTPHWLKDARRSTAATYSAPRTC